VIFAELRYRCVSLFASLLVGASKSK